jgi:hypothetical protein
MSACPNFSNFTFSRAPVKLSSILLPLLLTYPCAFGSLVWEQLVELLLQKWPDGAKSAQACWIPWRFRGSCTDPIGRIPTAPPFFTGVTKEEVACSALLQPRDLTAHLYHRRDASNNFHQTSFLFTIYIQFLRKRNHSTLTLRSPRDLRAVPPLRIGIPITTPYPQQTQNSDRLYLNSRRQPQGFRTLHIHPPVWQERITKATPSWRLSSRT